jgi:hypothetical protein
LFSLTNQHDGRIRLRSGGFARVAAVALAVLAAALGCNAYLPPVQEELFSLPLVVNGVDVGHALIDTGGGYEVLLRESFGLTLVDQARVIAFGGFETVGVTESFEFAVGGYQSMAGGALVGLSVCDCNGLGYHFFRRTGLTLAVDFPSRLAYFLPFRPDSDLTIPFREPPAHMPDFDGAFIQVEIEANGRKRTVLGLLDTGASITVMRRGLISGALPLAGVQEVFLTEPQLGKLQATVGLFDNDELPDIILGLDVMRVWADRWVFDFGRQGERGSISLFFRNDAPAPPPSNGGNVLLKAFPTVGIPDS